MASPIIPATRAADPPTTRPMRGPACWPIQPMIGPPTGVEPMKATAQRPMTRPRISGAASSWSTVVPSDRNVIEAAPTATRAAISKTSVGAAAATRITAPRASVALTRAIGPLWRRLAVSRPPTTAPAPMAAVRRL